MSLCGRFFLCDCSYSRVFTVLTLIMSMFVAFSSLFWPFSRVGFFSRISGETLRYSSVRGRFLDVIVLIRGFLLC